MNDGERTGFDLAMRKADVSFAQLESDPICPTSGCPITEEEKKKPPVVYNMYPGDQDLDEESQTLGQLEKSMGKWDIDTNEYWATRDREGWYGL